MDGRTYIMAVPDVGEAGKLFLRKHF